MAKDEAAMLMLGFCLTDAGCDFLHLFLFLGAVRTGVGEVYGCSGRRGVACVRSTAQSRVFPATAVTEADVVTSGAYATFLIRQLGEVSDGGALWGLVFTSPGLQQSVALGEFTGLSPHVALVVECLDDVADQSADGLLAAAGAVRTHTLGGVAHLARVVARARFTRTVETGGVANGLLLQCVVSDCEGLPAACHRPLAAVVVAAAPLAPWAHRAGSSNAVLAPLQTGFNGDVISLRDAHDEAEDALTTVQLPVGPAHRGDHGHWRVLVLEGCPAALVDPDGFPVGRESEGSSLCAS